MDLIRHIWKGENFKLKLLRDYAQYIQFVQALADAQSGVVRAIRGDDAAARIEQMWNDFSRNMAQMWRLCQLQDDQQAFYRFLCYEKLYQYTFHATGHVLISDHAHFDTECNYINQGKRIEDPNPNTASVKMQKRRRGGTDRGLSCHAFNSERGCTRGTACINAQNAQNPITVQQHILSATNERYRRPKWHRGYLGIPFETPIEPSMESTLTAAPVPLPPDDALARSLLDRCRQDYPGIFEVHTSIDVERFTTLLLNEPNPHPNRAHVLSVMHALQHGFWPWGAGFDSSTEAPRTAYNHPTAVVNPDELRKARDKELAAGRWMPLPDNRRPLHSIQSPLGIIPKNRREPHKKRLITDHSAPQGPVCE